MSAYLCDPYHIGRLAAFLEHEEKRSPAVQIAKILAHANVRSVIARYPDVAEDFSGVPGPVGLQSPEDYVQQCVKEAELFWADDFTPADMYSAAACFAYQACEAGDWRTCEARQITDRVQYWAVKRFIPEHSQRDLDPEAAKRTPGIPITRMMG